MQNANFVLKVSNSDTPNYRVIKRPRNREAFKVLDSSSFSAELRCFLEKGSILFLKGVGTPDFETEPQPLKSEFEFGINGNPLHQKSSLTSVQKRSRLSLPVT